MSIEVKINKSYIDYHLEIDKEMMMLYGIDYRNLIELKKAPEYNIVEQRIEKEISLYSKFRVMNFGEHHVYFIHHSEDLRFDILNFRVHWLITMYFAESKVYMNDEDIKYAKHRIIADPNTNHIYIDDLNKTWMRKEQEKAINYEIDFNDVDKPEFYDLFKQLYDLKDSYRLTKKEKKELLKSRDFFVKLYQKLPDVLKSEN